MTRLEINLGEHKNRKGANSSSALVVTRRCFESRRDRRSEQLDPRLSMSPSPVIAKICEKLVFLHGIRVYGSNEPEEPRLTAVSISKPRIVAKSFVQNLFI
jgi:hypothetical protein